MDFFRKNKKRGEEHMKGSKKFKDEVNGFKVDDINKDFSSEDDDYQQDEDYFTSDFDDETDVLAPDENERDYSEDDGVKEFSFDEELSLRVKKIVKIIDLLEFVDSCLIVSEKLLKDDEDAREILRDLREKVLGAETIFTDYLINGKIQKPN
jgi:hypothetical protein